MLKAITVSTLLLLCATCCNGFVAPTKSSPLLVLVPGTVLETPRRYDSLGHDRRTSVLASTTEAPFMEEGNEAAGDNNNMANTAIDDTVEPSALDLPPANKFDLETALFCSGLAFDSYIEPAQNSSRWERGVRKNKEKGRT